MLRIIAGSPIRCPGTEAPALVPLPDPAPLRGRNRADRHAIDALAPAEAGGLGWLLNAAHALGRHRG